MERVLDQEWRGLVLGVELALPEPMAHRPEP